MPLTVLKDAIESHPFPPKNIKISVELWKRLNEAGRIKWERGYIKGVIDSEIDFPVFDGKIIVHVVPELNDFSYQLPKSS